MHVRVQDSAFQVQKACGAGGGNSADIRFTVWVGLFVKTIPEKLEIIGSIGFGVRILICRLWALNSKP